MRTDEVMRLLLQNYPNGVSFAPMALRLLRQKIPLSDSQIEELKALMFQLGDDLWFSSDMITDEKTQLAIQQQATAWLSEQGCFSVEKLLNGFRDSLCHVSTVDHFADFLRHLGFTVATWKRSGLFCFQPPSSLDERLAEESRAISERLEKAGGTLALEMIQEEMPHLTSDALEGIRLQLLPEVHRTEIAGLPCWCSMDAIHLPEDFAEKLTATVDTLVSLGERVSAPNLAFALDLSYRVRFREVYGLSDNDAFMRVCAKYYQGENNAFFDKTKSHKAQRSGSSKTKRTRGSNTRFQNLGVPIGATLVFTRDAHITCTVLNGTNRVEYQGKPWPISRLANHLLNYSSANGFTYFSYEGETLWDRRLRLEQNAAPNVRPVKTEPQQMVNRQTEGGAGV